MIPSETSAAKTSSTPKHPVPPTVVDVARVADVALGTVSRVLNTPESVRPDIGQRVLDAIASTGYRRLRQRRAPTVADAGRRRRRGNFGIVLIGMDESLAHLPVITKALHGVELADMLSRRWSGLTPSPGWTGRLYLVHRGTGKSAGATGPEAA